MGHLAFQPDPLTSKKDWALVATTEQLQTMADLIQKYPAEAQLIIAALEDGLTLGPMQVMKSDGKSC